MPDPSTLGRGLRTLDDSCIAVVETMQAGCINPVAVPLRTRDSLPLLLTPREAASVLRVTPKALYAMIDRDQLPGVIRMGRRLRIDTRVLLHWLDRKCSAPSPKENGR